jgi:tryptophan-rich hypothetical protein
LNKINPKALLHSKWTKVAVINKEKHFAVIQVDYDEDQKVMECIVEAVLTKKHYAINWRDFKKNDIWIHGWQ